MSNPKPNITVPVDLTNPGQFFACCGLLELADRLWPGAEGWFEGGDFLIDCKGSLFDLLSEVMAARVNNTMTNEQLQRLDILSAMSQKQRSAFDGAEEEKKQLESLRRELPITLSGPLNMTIDWFADDLSGGSKLKTWAGQQSVLEIARSMHGAIDRAGDIWESCRGTGLPFNFDSNLGSQGSALDIGFSFDPLAGSELTRIAGECRPALELLAFVGLQRFRPLPGESRRRFAYAAWQSPLGVAVAAAYASSAVVAPASECFLFPMLFRTKYLKSFLPASAQGPRDE